MDKEANANGGMLVIATSVPDEREWIQWRGRTARQDRPGQFHVVLSRQAPPLVDRAGLAEQLLGMASHEQRLSRLLEIAAPVVLELAQAAVGPVWIVRRHRRHRRPHAARGQFGRQLVLLQG